MKKNFSFCGMAIIALLLYSCGNKDAFTISGTVKNKGSLKSVYLLRADTSISVVDSTQLGEDGTFKMKFGGAYANFYKLRVGGAVFGLIAKNGDDIGFSTDLSDTSHLYNISGSDESAKMQEFNKFYNVYVAENNNIINQFQDKFSRLSATAKDSVSKMRGVDSLRAVYMPAFIKVLNQQSAAIIKFMNDNKSSLAGFYAATSLDTEKYEQPLIEYADAIKDNFKDNPVVQRFKNQMAAIKPVSIGQPAPDFTIVGLDGKPVKLSDYKGKYVMLDFWASWCMPCREENPNVVKAYAAYHSKGFNILGISLDTSKPDWQKAIEHDHLTWAHASDLKNFNGPTGALYHIMGIPANFLIDPKGVIVAKNLRGNDLEDFLNKTFNKPQ